MSIEQKETLLVVDDNLTNRKMLVGALGKVGYATLEAKDGLEALHTANAELPDLVLLDVSMPLHDGFEVCEALKANEDTAEIPVIFLTASSDPTSIERAFGVGGCDYVTKPFHMGEVKARVEVHLQLRRARAQLLKANKDLLRAQRLDSIGQLAAGIAHEINTPTQFVSDNIRFFRDAFEDLVPLLFDSLSLAESAQRNEASSAAATALVRAFEEVEFKYLSDEVPRALLQSIDGMERVAKIVGAMKEFTLPGFGDKAPVDLNHALDSAVTVGANEWKYVADFEMDLDPDLPEVVCCVSQINQVFLNLIVNAAYAVADVVDEAAEEKGQVRIVSRRDGDHVEIRISDTGSGIAPDVRDRVFDPFFTTKAVGEGSGQGLAIAHDVVVRKHGGALDFESELGAGTTFTVRLPLKPEEQEDDFEELAA